MTKGETTRQQIIQQAAPLFNQRGFAGASMQDIMEATGLEKGCLYRHFASKQELAVEAFHYTLAQAVEARTRHLAEIPHSIDKLRHMVKAFVEAHGGKAMVTSAPGHGSVFLVTFPRKKTTS